MHELTLIFKLMDPRESKAGGGGWLGKMVEQPGWKVGGRGFVPHAGIQVSKQQNVFSPLTRLILSER